MIARTFLIRSIETGSVRGFAVLSEDAAYCAVTWVGDRAVERRTAPPHHWAAVCQELALGLEPGPLAWTGPIVTLIAGEAGVEVSVQYITAIPIECADLRQAGLLLDSQLAALRRD